jgi:alpha-1,3-rhamnosyl/mannosyltransferase
MRIAIDARTLLMERTGIGHYTEHLLHGLGCVDKINQYTLFYLNAFRRAFRRSFPPFPYPNFNTRGAIFPNRLLDWFFKEGVPILPVELLVGCVDVFHFPNYALLPQWTGRKIVTFHDLTVLLFPQFHTPRRCEILGPALYRAAAKADRIVVDSEATRRDVLHHFSVSARKVVTIPLAPGRLCRPRGEDEVAEVLSRYGLTYRRYLLHLGTIEPRKNLPRLLHAFLRMRHDGMVFPLVLAGSIGWDNGETARTAEALQLGQALVRLGYVSDEDAASLLSGAACLVYPSYYEGFGLPVLEAMASGTPVVASNTSSIPEVAGDSAVLVSPEDEIGLAAAVSSVLRDSDRQENMRRRGLVRAAAFTWERTARETLAVYRAAVENPCADRN